VVTIFAFQVINMQCHQRMIDKTLEEL